MAFSVIQALVHPPTALQAVLVAAPLHELPDAAGPRARKCQRLKSALRLCQIDQVLGYAFFAKHAGDHRLELSGAAQAIFDNRTAPRRLEKVEVGHHRVVHGQWQIVGNFFGGDFRVLLQLLVDGKRQFRHFINGRRNGGSFAEAIAGAKGLQLVGVNRVRDLMEKLAQPRIAVGVVAALQHPIHGVIKIAPRGFQVAGAVIGFPRSEFLFYFFDQVLDAAGNGRLQRNNGLQSQIPQRERTDIGHGGGRNLRRVQRRNVRLQRLSGGVVATRQAQQQCKARKYAQPGAKDRLVNHFPMVCRALQIGQ